eukprot:CAMPEP_0168183312 /NCGR_PEP_ID=MMETSP0139_2-20121125/12463_1 /TAXON_ID=44445 /ORGANISM="Pseudo-nitzschia australis, Strain 10249 10 AB" /LENGTH=335 /DNA_ID=CAMNT_0008104507 /DNA_START=139 /DNA_END=1146 /DNA_ORIENTATION=+
MAAASTSIHTACTSMTSTTTTNPKKNNELSPRKNVSEKKKKRSRYQGRNNRKNNNDKGGNSKSTSVTPGGKANSRQQQPKGHNKHMSERKLSHSLSWVLRHAALDIGLNIREDGFVPVQEILDSTHPKLRGATLEIIKLVVEKSDKQRFKLEERQRDLHYSNSNDNSNSNNHKDEDLSTTKGNGKETILCIRANQGHSIALINPELLLKKLSPDDVRLLPCIVHGTYPKAWESIQQAQGGGGLKKMNRTHIHFASGLPTDDGVISGMRKSCSIYIYIDGSKCAADARIEFFRSDNGVILTDGVGNSGVLPIDYFSHATDSSGKILMDNRNREVEK